MIDRNISVCFDKKCGVCHSSDLVVPIDCPYAILHPLELDTGRTLIWKWTERQLQKWREKNMGKS